MSQIIHYDIGVDEFRVVTQKDWDAMFIGAHRIHNECIRLQALLREHGIPLPKGVKDRTDETPSRGTGTGLWDQLVSV